MEPADVDTTHLPLHRSEALTDGIYAVAMTLLVIELKLPDPAAIHSSAELANALVELLPKALAWLISFGVLALFWLSHHRVFRYLRRTDTALVTMNLVQLAFVSLMPFSCAVVGERGVLLAQVIYSINMAALGVTGLLIVGYVHRHPELAPVPMPKARYLGARVRIVGLIAISVVAVLLAATVPWPGAGNMAFMLMAVISRVSRRVEHRALAAAPT